MSLEMPGLDDSALLRRHYAGLPGLIVRFVQGPEGDGPVIADSVAADIVTELYGRAGRATYGGAETG